MSSPRQSNRQTCNGIIDDKACTKSLSCSSRYCSQCGKQNPFYVAASAQSGLATDSNRETDHTTDTSGSDDEKCVDATDDQNNARKPSERHPMLRSNEMDPHKVDNIVDSSSEDLETGSQSTREANPGDDGKSGSTQESSHKIMEAIKKKYKEEGPIETKKYIDEMLDEWKKASVKIGITGTKNVGKSTFINFIRHIKPGEPGYAKSGAGDITKMANTYVDPTNRRIVYVDFPGFGSLLMPRDVFLQRVDLPSFDFFLIFFKDVLSQDDAWLAERLTNLNKPFCLIRSMLDLAIDNEKHDKPDGKGKNEVEIVKGIREHAKSSMNTNSELKNATLFVISCRNPQLGEMSSFLIHLKHTLPKAKFQAIMFALPVFSKEVIEEKYEVFKNRISSVSRKAGFFCALTVFPGIGRFLVQNPFIKWEVEDYLKAFGLTEKQIAEVPDVPKREKIPDDSTSYILIRILKSVVPIVGPGVEGGLRVNDVLNKTLECVRTHAYNVHAYCLAPDSFNQTG